MQDDGVAPTVATRHYRVAVLSNSIYANALSWVSAEDIGYIEGLPFPCFLGKDCTSTIGHPFKRELNTLIKRRFVGEFEPNSRHRLYFGSPTIRSGTR
jgi:hypothetical protein